MREKLKEKLNKATAWCKENKDILVIVVPAVVTTAAAASKLGGKALDAWKVSNHQNKRIYDSSLGHYWELRRKLNNQEYFNIEQRRKAGERLADILNDMKVLK